MSRTTVQYGGVPFYINTLVAMADILEGADPNK